MYTQSIQPMVPIIQPIQPIQSMQPIQPMDPMIPIIPMPPVMAPTYYPPPPPIYYPSQPLQPLPQQQTIIITGNNQEHHGSPCRTCGRDTNNVTRKTIGTTAIIWFICLLFTGFACYIPFTRDSCKDTQLVCTRCSTVKNRIPANCC